MPDENVVCYTLEDIKRMREGGLIRETAPDAPEFEPDEEFWRNARIVPTALPRRTSKAESADENSLESEPVG
jgi:hypothetical protein